MKNILFILITLSIFVCSGMSCHPHSNSDWPYPSYKFINNSNIAIYWGLSYSYPDTNVNKIEDKPYSGNIAHKVNPKDSEFIRILTFAVNPTLQLFLFDADVIETTPWDSIVKHYMVLKRIEYTADSLRRNNWTITYP